MRLGVSLAVATVIGLLFGARAQATVITYTDEAAFVTATGSALRTLPNVTFISGSATPPGSYGAVVTGQFTISAATPSGLNTIAAGTGLTSFNLDPTNNYIGKSGEEEYNIVPLTALTMYAFAFTVYEPSGSQLLNGCNQTCVESEFVITLLSGSTTLLTQTLRPANDTFEFLGFWSSDEITRVEIRELAVNPLQTALLADNEFFGHFYTGFTQYVPSETSRVPEPTILALAVAGLGLMGMARHRRA